MVIYEKWKEADDVVVTAGLAKEANLRCYELKWEFTERERRRGNR